MKLKVLLSSLVVLFMFTNCVDDALDIPSPVDISTAVDDVEIPFATVEGVEIDGPIDIKLNVDFEEVVKEEVDIPGFTIDNIKRAELKSFKVKLSDSDFIGDLSAVKDMDLYIKSENPTFEEIKVGQIRDNENSEELDFEIVTDKDIAKYCKAEDTYIVLRNIVGGDNSLTTFTIEVIPEWHFTFRL